MHYRINPIKNLIGPSPFFGQIGKNFEKKTSKAEQTWIFNWIQNLVAKSDQCNWHILQPTTSLELRVKYFSNIQDVFMTHKWWLFTESKIIMKAVLTKSQTKLLICNEGDGGIDRWNHYEIHLSIYVKSFAKIKARHSQIQSFLT